MAKFKCLNKNCKSFQKEITIPKTTSIIENGEIIVKEGFCDKCGEYMSEIKTFNGWSTNTSNFKNKSSQEKRKFFQERSTKHFNKHIKEKKRYLDKNYGN